MTSTERIHLSVPAARELAQSAVEALGYDAQDSRVIADHMIDAALCGYEYSGLPKILNVADAPQAKQPKQKPRIVFETPVSARMDGGNSVGMLALARATDVVIEKARASGIGLVSMGNTFTSGRSAYYMEKIARADMIGFLAISSTRTVAPLGGAKAALGTNPIAFGLPVEGGNPLIFDMGTSAFMASELMFFRRLGKLLPDGVAIDKEGSATRDPAAVMEGGALLPFGGHKGYGLALIIHALGMLDGLFKDDEQRSGYLLIAFKPELLVSLEDYKKQLRLLIDRVKSTPRLPGIEEIRIPSERSFRERALNLSEGIEIDRSIHDALHVMASRKGL